MANCRHVVQPELGYVPSLGWWECPRAGLVEAMVVNPKLG